MADVVLDATRAGNSTTDTNPTIQWQDEGLTEDDRVCVVLTECYADTDGDCTGVAWDPTGANVPFTQFDVGYAVLFSPTPRVVKQQWWYLKDADLPVGIAFIAASFTSAAGNVRCAARSLTAHGVDQTSPFVGTTLDVDDDVPDSGSPQPSVDVQSLAGALAIAMVSNSSLGPDTFTPGGGATAFDGGHSAVGAFAMLPSTLIASGSSTTMSFTGADDDETWMISGVALRPVGAGGGDVELDVDDATIGLAAESPSLTQQNTLAVADATIALAAESPALTQANILAVADALIALAAESPALVQQNTLVVADALIALASDPVALTQQNTLAVADATIALTAENVELSLANLLEVADALIALAAEQPALTQQNTLVVAGALIALGAESPVLVQAHVLTVGDTVIALVADNVVLLTGNIGTAGPGRLSIVAIASATRVVPLPNPLTVTPL